MQNISLLGHLVKSWALFFKTFGVPQPIPSPSSLILKVWESGSVCKLLDEPEAYQDSCIGRLVSGSRLCFARSGHHCSWRA